MNKVIRKGDTLREYGGRVLMGHYQCFGLGFACKGDPVKCNKHGMTTIAEGSARTTIDGQPVALHGHRCACGCTLVIKPSELTNIAVERLVRILHESDLPPGVVNLVTGGGETKVPELLISIGSTALGALAGLLMPTGGQH